MTITIVTASKSNPENLFSLRSSLENQSSLDFTWHISVPSSSDLSLDALAGCKLDYNVNTDPDLGVYSALNQLIKVLPPFSYYIVAGDDDIFSSCAIESFASLIQSHSSSGKSFIYTANALRSGKLLTPKFSASLYQVGQMKFLASHSVATCIPVNAHINHGLYDESYRIAADEKFLLTSYLDSSITYIHSPFIAGSIGDGGVSRTVNLDLYIESMKAKSCSLNDKLIALSYSFKFLKYFLFN